MLLALTVGISKSATRIAISYLGSMIRNCSIGERKRLGVRKGGEINTLRSPSPRVRERIYIYVYMCTKREGGQIRVTTKQRNPFVRIAFVVFVLLIAYRSIRFLLFRKISRDIDDLVFRLEVDL